ncbi:uncharacterized protein LOC141911864 [Tubulanus polymorphus]|uniref:uncharacterized protein LOC141911864 n=1 Tax=Tubulanus polymorphus TaxID=672921 RepID=UPI003DA62B1B
MAHCAESGVLEVSVKMASSGKTRHFDMSRDDRVADVRERIATDEKVDARRVVLKYMGKILERFAVLGKLGVCKDTILKAEISTVKDWTVTIEIADEPRRAVTLHVQNITTFNEISRMLKYKEGLEPGRDGWLYLKDDSGKKDFRDGETAVKDVGLADGAVLILKKRQIPVSPERSSEDNETLQVQEAGADADKVDEVMSSFQTDGRSIEVVFSFDTTGSMYSCLEQVRTKLRETVTRLLRDIPTIRIGIIGHGDYCDDTTAGGNKYVVKMKDLTTDVDDLVSFVESVPSTCGGDSPECYEWVLHKAQQLDWGEHSAKALVIIGDACPHNPGYTDLYINWLDELDILKGMDIKVYGVQALSNSHAACFYNEMSSRTGGAALALKDFQLITDMFLAVCYNESSPEQLQQYCEEIEQEGRMNEATKEMFDKLEEQQQEQKKKEKEGEKTSEKLNENKEFKASWWRDDRTKSPKYSYDSVKDKWHPYGDWNRYPDIEKDDSAPEPVTSSPPPSPTSSSNRSSAGEKKTVWKRIKRSFSIRKRKTNK